MNHITDSDCVFGQCAIAVLDSKQKPSRQRDPAQIAGDVVSTHTLQNTGQGVDTSVAQ